MSLTGDNKEIKIPLTHYVGFQARHHDDVPLGFMTPDGTDSASTKRKATVDSWSKQGGHIWNPTTRSYDRKDPLPSVSYENKPLSGFKMGREIRRNSGWGQGNVKWRIEDPRGFELEISSPNFAQIILCTTIENGEILEECVWGRLGAENILLPISSEVYKAAVINSERMAKKVSLKDLKPGHKVVLQNGEEGIFLGSFFTLDEQNHKYGEQPSVKWYDKRRSVLATLNKNNEIEKIECRSALKVAEVYDSPLGTFSIEDSEKKINDFIKQSKNSIYTGSSYTSKNVIGVSAVKKKSEDIEFTFEPVLWSDLFKQANPRRPSATSRMDHITVDNIKEYVVAQHIPSNTWYHVDAANTAGAIQSFENMKNNGGQLFGQRFPHFAGSRLQEGADKFIFVEEENQRNRGYYNIQHYDAYQLTDSNMSFFKILVKTEVGGETKTFYL